MSTHNDIGAIFEQEGGIFVAPPAVIAAKLERIRAVALDWDGVFNRGEKAAGVSSGFSEADSMGLNMLRYAFWQRDGELPYMAIISGEANASAEYFAGREHFHMLFRGVRDKRLAIATLQRRYALDASEIACVFDDINDLSMAAGCGLRIAVRRRASMLLRRHLVDGDACEYVTACESGENALRESSELLLGLMGAFETVLASRTANDETYRAYFDARQEVELLQPSVEAGA